MVMDKIEIKTRVNAPLSKVWEFWNDEKHIVNWNAASPEWHTTKAENDLRPDGRFSYRMEAKDGSFGFDFEGTYRQVEPQQFISYELGDGRKTEIHFSEKESQVEITEIFDPESQNSLDLQRQGWQAILDNFKSYVETT